MKHLKHFGSFFSLKSFPGLEHLAWLFLYVGIAGMLQIYTSYPWDPDTAYHAVVGRLTAEHGILHSFPWTEFSWLADHYADKELLFHLLFVPLNNLDWVTAAKIVGTVSGAFMLFSLYIVLRKESVRLAGLWAMVPLAASGYFVFRLALVRPFVLSIGLAIIFLWAASRGRLVILAVVAAIYPWTYVAFWQLPCVLLFVSGAASLLSGGRFQWKPVVVAVLGIIAGAIVHPNASNLIEASWINMTEMLFKNTWGGRGNFEMGQELSPFTLAQWGRCLLPSVAMAASGLYFAWRNRRKDETMLAFALAGLCFVILTITSRKFAEYFIPFSAAAMALASRSISRRFFLQGVLVLSMVYTLLLGRQAILSLPTRPYDLPASLASLLPWGIPPGSHVFTTDWDYTGKFMVELPDRYFMVALDPTFFYTRNPDLYNLWMRLMLEAPEGSADAIRKNFGSQYVLGLNHPSRWDFFSRLLSEPGVRLLYNDNGWVLIDLGRAMTGVLSRKSS